MEPITIAFDKFIFHFPHPHSSENIAFRVFEALNDWGLKDKIFCVTSDRGPKFLKAGKLLTGKLQDETLNVVDININFQNYCGAHIVNNLVVNFLLSVNRTKKTEPCSDLIVKIRYLNI